ncbi:hypothetical protein [Nocardiopsis sp. CNT312]|uniref:hypothetical protein n=1 Tax=Nocardiopsis sp. CNT312 TaxID=1137268 RepID=UPI0004BC346A
MTRPGTGERVPVRRRASTPLRVWTLTGVCLAMIAGLFSSSALALGQARDGLYVLGRDAGPRAMATTDLYLALADMDARVADVLLMGTGHDLGSGREDALERYGSSRDRANEALLQAASLTEGDSVEERNVQEVLDGMGDYERLATQARLSNDRAEAPPGEVDAAALAEYRRATRLMHTELLPKAFNLGLDSSAIVRRNHGDGQRSVALGLVWVCGAGTAALASLAGLQLYFRARFRRRFNPPLLAATAGTVALTVGVVLVLNTGSGHQHDAKEEGLDAAMALARAGALATDMQADQSRYLADPGQADAYQQVYLERAQQILFRPAENLDAYYARVDEVAAAYPDLPGGREGDGDPGTLGYLGERAQEAILPGQEHEDALAEVLECYDRLQEQDGALREAARDGDTDTAIAVRMAIADSENGTFPDCQSALDGLTELHVEAFHEGIERGEAVLSLWAWLPTAGSLALLGLVLLGVRPRLAEYR